MYKSYLHLPTAHTYTHRISMCLSMNWTPSNMGQLVQLRQGRQAYHIAILCIGDEADDWTVDEWCPKISGGDIVSLAYQV